MDESCKLEHNLVKRASHADIGELLNRSVAGAA